MSNVNTASDSQLLSDSPTDVLDIRPEMGVLSALQHLNYKVWYALAEFVDNSVQSALDNIEALRSLHGADYRVKVEIEVDHTPGHQRLVIRDNAAGIARRDYSRAFRLASVPLNATGLSEFGMGMKTAGCWLSDSWEVRSSAINEPEEGRVIFDVKAIISQDKATLCPIVGVMQPQKHYTEITLYKLRHDLSGSRTIGKIRLSLGDIFRSFLRSGFLELTYDNQAIKYTEPAPLRAQFVTKPGAQPSGPLITWQRCIDLNLSRGVRVHGMMGLLATGSTTRAGFALMRRGRLIRGADGETFRPSEIFGNSNSFKYQRLYGELTLDGVPVSHTKDDFALESFELELIDALKEAADAEEMPLLRQAENFRATVAGRQRIDVADAAAATTIEEVSKNPKALERRDDDGDNGQLLDGPSPAIQPVSLGDGQLVTSDAEVTTPHVREQSRTFIVDGEQWTIAIHFRDDPAVGDWIDVKESLPGTAERLITIAFGLAHPFVQRFAKPDSSDLELLVRLACAIGIAEITARMTGISKAGHFRRTVNKLLRDAMSRA